MSKSKAKKVICAALEIFPSSLLFDLLLQYYFGVLFNLL